MSRGWISLRYRIASWCLIAISILTITVQCLCLAGKIGYDLEFQMFIWFNLVLFVWVGAYISEKENSPQASIAIKEQNERHRQIVALRDKEIAELRNTLEVERDAFRNMQLQRDRFKAGFDALCEAHADLGKQAADQDKEIAALKEQLGQHTVCAVCLKDKPTPLRRDEMGGYVCLTCVDKRLDKRLDEETK